MASSLCLFVCSSDNTHDVFNATFGNLLTTWPVRELSTFVGTNTRDVPEPLAAVHAPVNGWRKELLYQIQSLPPQIEYVTLLLDDFFFHEPVQEKLLLDLAARLHDLRGDYLRLRPVERAVLPWVIRRIRSILGLLPAVEQLKTSEPYYSSLQVAIWRREYLIARLSTDGSIWDFEHEVPKNSRHFAITKARLNYDHLVEKGKWYRSAPKLLDLPSTSPVFARGFEPDPFKNAKLYNRLKFMLIGYTVFRIRRLLSSRVSP